MQILQIIGILLHLSKKDKVKSDEGDIKYKEVKKTMVRIKKLIRDGKYVVYQCGKCGGVYSATNKNMARHCCENRKRQELNENW